MTDDIILLSIVNARLRDFCDDLDDLCDKYDYDKDELLQRFDSINYYYNAEENQFKEKM